MSSRRVEVEGVGFDVWDKSFRLNHCEGFYGPIIFVGDASLDDAMTGVARTVKAARRWQHGLDTTALEATDPDEIST